MADQFDIFRKQSDYETDPPQELEVRMFNGPDDELALQKDSTIQGCYEHLQELEVNPPGHAFLFIKNKIDHLDKLFCLQNLEVAPQSWIFSAILNKVKPPGKQIRESNSGIFHLMILQSKNFLRRMILKMNK